jgi:hypothetical protein
VEAGAGIAVDPRDTIAFAAALASLARDDAKVAAMSLAAFTGTQHLALSPDAWIDRLLAQYGARLAQPFQTSPISAAAAQPAAASTSASSASPSRQLAASTAGT